METFFKIFAVVFTLLFGYAIVVQFNDPDALKWVLIYLTAAVASVLFLLKKLKSSIYFLLTIFFLVLFFVYWPETYEGVQLDHGMKTVNIEEGRESLGSLIAAVVMLVYGLRTRFLNKSKV
ncbi:transmembrane 220 family protein [Muricauda sp. 334s03]|uniref:Transmembrane 220 family protein n=1 Tax=Flagellimonas yonaguniensis TaxID=3031325 RepID=A0ABT5Y245_9FLAO|nr:transmembrane 220 family protein [[Muricauda] yonaguniensis]MDF0717512.1 transmembrane 220 family protein [[Muricauda] yonaguniensis]